MASAGRRVWVSRVKTLRDKMIDVAETHFEDLTYADFSNPYSIETKGVDARERAKWLVDELYDEVYTHVRDAIGPLADEFNLSKDHLYRD